MKSIILCWFTPAEHLYHDCTHRNTTLFSKIKHITQLRHSEQEVNVSKYVLVLSGDFFKRKQRENKNYIMIGKNFSSGEV